MCYFCARWRVLADKALSASTVDTAHAVFAGFVLLARFPCQVLKTAAFWVVAKMGHLVPCMGGKDPVCSHDDRSLHETSGRGKASAAGAVLHAEKERCGVPIRHERAFGLPTSMGIRQFGLRL